VAEDSPVNQKLALAMLRKMGHQVTLAATGTAAVETWKREAFDLVLMDIQMPEMDGLEATRNIRAIERPGGARTPIIAMTAHAMERRSGTLPGGRHGRPRHQADQPRGGSRGRHLPPHLRPVNQAERISDVASRKIRLVFDDLATVLDEAALGFFDTVDRNFQHRSERRAALDE
jgi:CheY-like chemotaxis protein